MKIVVLNGSPKGDNSVTMQYVAFIKKKYSQHEFVICNVAQGIRKLESDNQVFEEITEKVRAADGVVWAFPLYVFLVHSGYKRFIELITERAAQEAFAGKPAAILTTSIHFFDHTAHNYLHGICDDLDMKVYGSYSAGMHDIFKEDARGSLLEFSETFFAAIEGRLPAAKVYPPILNQGSEYVPGSQQRKFDAGGLKVVIVTDAEEYQINLKRMIESMTARFSGQAEVFNLHNVDIKGGCLGCIKCGYDNTCAYSGKDGFIDFYNSRIKNADIIIFAGAICDRYLSSLWKTFFDRAFFNTHMPMLKGKQIGFLISGPFRQLPNLRQIFEGYTEWQEANLAGIVTDEYSESKEIDGLLEEMARQSIEFAKRRYIKPATFLGVGGRKIFRDEIWGQIRFPFAADHKYYKDNGVYDFPQRDYTTRLRNILFGLLIKVPAVRDKLYGGLMITKMVEPYKKLLAKL
ncbi:MAG: hypothetical protein H6Q73_361 [Firmicutes bacterium]|nr:hypothetical protein [Bacillota bacterium]